MNFWDLSLVPLIFVSIPCQASLVTQMVKNPPAMQSPRFNPWAMKIVWRREVQFSSVQSLSRVRLFATLWIAARQPPCPSPTPGVHANSCPSSQWCHPAISSSVVPFSSCPQSLPASGSFPGSALPMRWPKYWSFSFNIIPSNEYSGLVGSPCSPRNSQESSPTPQYKSINSSAPSFLHSPTLTSIHNHWKNHSLD